MKKINLISCIVVFIPLFVASFSEAASLIPTIYYIKTIDTDQACESKRTIFSVEGEELAKVCKDAYKKCVIEGTCVIGNESTIEFEMINYIKMKNDRPTFATVDKQKCPWGYGVRAICLDPYFTLAADLTFHKPGDVIFIEKLQGLRLPSGETHSGFMIIRDKGGAIKGQHRFDFYTGLIPYQDARNPFTELGLNSKTNKFEYRKATPEEAEQIRKERNFPGIPR